MTSKIPDRHQLALGILAIGTAAIGFGLFGGDLRIGELARPPGLGREIQWAKLVGVGFTTVFYFLVLVTVGRVLSKDHVTGNELTNGPMAWLYMEMVSLAWLYIFGVIEDLAIE